MFIFLGKKFSRPFPVSLSILLSSPFQSNTNNQPKEKRKEPITITEEKVLNKRVPFITKCWEIWNVKQYACLKMQFLKLTQKEVDICQRRHNGLSKFNCPEKRVKIFFFFMREIYPNCKEQTTHELLQMSGAYKIESFLTY